MIWHRGKGRNRKQRGAALAEMGIVVGLISVVSIGAVVSVGDEAKDVFCTAAGSLNKAMGGDGYCLGEMTAVDSVFEGPAFLDVMFRDRQFGMSEPGSGMIEPRKGSLTGGISLTTDGHGEIAVSPCVGGSCAPVSSGVTGLEAASDDWENLGYDLALPAITEAVDTSFDLTVTSLEDPELWYTWTIGVTRSATPPALEPSIAFSDIILSEGAGLAVRPMELFDADKAIGEFSLSAVSRNGVDAAACWQTAEEASVACSELALEGREEGINPAQYKLGYRLAAPDGVDAFTDYTDVIDIAMTSDVDPSLSRDWTVNLFRPGATPVMDTNIEFANIDGVFSGTYWTAMTVNELRGDMMLEVDGRGMFEVGICTVSSTGWDSCADVSAVSTQKMDTSDTKIGYKFSPIGETDIWEDFAGEIGVRLYSKQDPSIEKTWDIQVTRAATVATLETDIEFADITGKYSGTSLVSLDNTTATGGVRLEVDGLGMFNVGYCYQDSTQSGCYSVSESFTQTVDLRDKKAGFKFSPIGGADPWEDFSGNLKVRLYNAKDPSLEKTWDVQVTRPANVASFDIDFDFTDIAGKVSGMKLPALKYNEAKGGLAIEVDGLGDFEVGYCFVDQWGRDCDSPYTGSFTQNIDLNDDNIGFKYRPVEAVADTEDFAKEIRVRVYNQKDPSLEEIWNVKVTRAPIAE